MNDKHDAVLTIAVPFGGGVDYLRLALLSIFAQRSDSWVVLLLNNAREPERTLARELARTFDARKLRYVEHETQVPPCDNFNAYLDLAETDLVSTVHADDEILPDYTEKVLRIAGSFPEAAAYFLPWRIIGADSKPRRSFVDWCKRWTKPGGRGDMLLRGESALRSLLRGNWINGGAICFRKSRLGKLRFDPSLFLASDLDLWTRILLTGGAMAGPRSAPIYLYRRHRAQATTHLTASLERFTEETHLYDSIAARASGRGWISAARVARAKTIVKLYLAYLIVNDLMTGNFARVRRELSFIWDLRKGATGV